MVCMSASSTASLIDKVVDDYDVDVHFWKEKLKDLLLDVHMQFNCMEIVVFVNILRLTSQPLVLL